MKAIETHAYQPAPQFAGSACAMPTVDCGDEPVKHQRYLVHLLQANKAIGRARPRISNAGVSCNIAR